MRLDSGSRSKSLCVTLTLLLCLSLLMALPVAASAIDEADFWRSLQRTQTLLEAGDESARVTVLDEVRALWQNVDSVTLENGETITIDMGWLTNSETSLEQLADYSGALLDFYARGRNLSDIDTAAALNSLNGILQDPRFQYPTPTPFIQPPDSNLPDVALPSAELSQIVLIVVGVILVFAALAYFARGLRVQPTAIEPLDTGEDPTTSAQAQDLAQQSEAAQDYRAAIRYLYLASLLLLDERGVLRYDSALTNRELLRQVSNKSLHELLRVVVQTFDRVWYGFAPADAALYGEFRQHVEQLQRTAVS